MLKLTFFFFANIFSEILELSKKMIIDSVRQLLVDNF